MRNYFVLDANLFHAYSAKVSARGYKLNRNVSVTKKRVCMLNNWVLNLITV